MDTLRRYTPLVQHFITAQRELHNSEADSLESTLRAVHDHNWDGSCTDNLVSHIADEQSI